MKVAPYSPQKAVLTPHDLESCRACKEPAYELVMAILRAVSEASGVPEKAILGRYRGTAQTVRARQIVMYVAARAGFTYSAIGRVLKRDHATVMHGVDAEKARRGEG